MYSQNREQQKQQRAKLREAATRCGIEDLDHLTNEQSDQIMAMLPIIEKEWAEAKVKYQAEHQARLAQLRAEVKARDDVIAAPYREQRRLRNLKKMGKS